MRIGKGESRCQLQLKINRKSNLEPEVYYAFFHLAESDTIPTISNAGIPFRPSADQLAGSCRDFYAMDGWVHYGLPEGDIVLNCRDNAMVTFGGTNVAARLDSLPQNAGEVYAVLFDNTWDTNFAADEHGIMEFTFDLMLHKKARPEDLTDELDALGTEPVVMIRTRSRSIKERET
jgi:hypothetical protein